MLQTGKSGQRRSIPAWQPRLIFPGGTILHPAVMFRNAHNGHGLDTLPKGCMLPFCLAARSPFPVRIHHSPELYNDQSDATSPTFHPRCIALRAGTRKAVCTDKMNMIRLKTNANTNE